MDPPNVDLKKTVNLPRTDFPMKANLREVEPRMLERWQQMDLYGMIRRASAGRPAYILQDGPPYANGNIHIGHAFNKAADRDQGGGRVGRAQGVHVARRDSQRLPQVRAEIRRSATLNR